jgi:hypothetical protein
MAAFPRIVIPVSKSLALTGRHTMSLPIAPASIRVIKASSEDHGNVLPVESVASTGSVVALTDRGFRTYKPGQFEVVDGTLPAVGIRTGL